MKVKLELHAETASPLKRPAAHMAAGATDPQVQKQKKTQVQTKEDTSAKAEEDTTVTAKVADKPSALQESSAPSTPAPAPSAPARTAPAPEGATMTQEYALPNDIDINGIEDEELLSLHGL